MQSKFYDNYSPIWPIFIRQFGCISFTNLAVFCSAIWRKHDIYTLQNARHLQDRGSGHVILCGYLIYNKLCVRLMN